MEEGIWILNIFLLFQFYRCSRIIYYLPDMCLHFCGSSHSNSTSSSMSLSLLWKWSLHIGKKKKVKTLQENPQWVWSSKIEARDASAEGKEQEGSVVWPRRVKENSWNRWSSGRIMKDKWDLGKWEEIQVGGRTWANSSIKEEESTRWCLMFPDDDLYLRF